eukprot:GEMP01112682.1.p1 GENE.GEMP01112682.1~~GEMP01112682.1.p1  ORF type:complete len:217 (+),score=44.40 GEMP01112682.1:39-653(+)
MASALDGASFSTPRADNSQDESSQPPGSQVRSQNRPVNEATENRCARIQSMRTALSEVQKIVQVVEEAEGEALEATKMSEEIARNGAPNVDMSRRAWKLSLSPVAQQDPDGSNDAAESTSDLSSALNRQVQRSILWTEQLLELSALADSDVDVAYGTTVHDALQDYAAAREKVKEQYQAECARLACPTSKLGMQVMVKSLISLW